MWPGHELYTEAMKIGAQQPLVASKRAAKPLKIVALGDSLTAGMQDANLVGTRQIHSYPAKVAQQAGVSLKQPLLDDKGIPPQLFLSPNSSLVSTALRYAMVGAAQLIPSVAVALGMNPPEFMFWPLYAAGGMGQREEQGEIQNFAIPGVEARHLNSVANVHDVVDDVLSGMEGKGSMLAGVPYARQILQGGNSARHGQTQLDGAIEQKPDMVMLWAGSNDALAGALKGEVNDSTLTPMEDRKWNITTKKFPWSKPREVQTREVIPGFESTMIGPKGLVTRLLNETDAEVMMMNIPDVTVIPHLFPLGQKVGPLPFRMMLPGGADVTEKIENWHLPLTVKGEGKDGRPIFPAGSNVGLATILKKLTHYYKVKTEADMDQALMHMSRNAGVFTEDDVLDPDEVQKIQSRVREYNALLSDIASKNDRVHLVDINGMLNLASKEGLELRGEGAPVTITTEFTGTTDERGFSGIFSFDGVHPSDIGQALIANQVLDKAREVWADNPRFEALVNAAPVDEKAVLQKDPHFDPNNRLLLDSYVSERLAF